MHRTSTISLAAVIVLLCGAATARAQQPPVSQGGPLVLEPMHNGFLFAPDVKVTKMNGQVGTLAGGYAGWIKDDRLFVGGGVYWRADRKRDSNGLAYGGLILGWFFDPSRPVSVSVKTLAGLGQYSWSSEPTVGIPYCLLPERYLCSMGGPSFDADRFDRRFHFRSEFLVLEPEVDVQAKLGHRVRLSAGAGYRLTDGSRGLDRVTRGVTGSVSVQFRLGK